MLTATSLLAAETAAQQHHVFGMWMYVAVFFPMFVWSHVSASLAETPFQKKKARERVNFRYGVTTLFACVLFSLQMFIQPLG